MTKYVSGDQILQQLKKNGFSFFPPQPFDRQKITKGNIIRMLETNLSDKTKLVKCSSFGDVIRSVPLSNSKQHE